MTRPIRPPVAAAGRGLTEALIERGLRDLLNGLGFVCFHTRFSIGSSGPGFPDLFCVGCHERTHGRFVALEVKGPRGVVSEAQRNWIGWLVLVPGCAYAAVVGPREAIGWVGYERAIEQIREAVGA